MPWSRFFRRKRWDEERAHEIESYIDTEAQNNIARGMTSDEARCAARRKLGNPSLIREGIYHMNTLHFFDSLWSDLRYATRTLRLNPGFAFVAIASLALGIGANTAIFELLDAVRLRTLPVKNPQELAQVALTDMSVVRGSRYQDHAVSNPIWEKIRAREQTFDGIFAWSDASFNVSPSGEARYVRGLWVSGDFFPVLGVPPLLGRLFNSGDDRRGCGFPGAVISYSFWQSWFGADPAVIGRKLTLDGNPVEVIGVTPASFFGLDVGHSFEVALPVCSLGAYGQRLDSGTTWWLVVMGRLKPGISIERASAELAAISPGLFEETLPSNYPQVSVKSYLALRLAASSAGRGISGLRREYTQPLFVLLATAGLVLLIACANLANLMLARASAREKEIAVRLAIGASRARLIRQLMAESLLLAAIGGALGLLLAGGLSKVLVGFLSTAGNAVFVDLRPDWQVLAFTGALAGLTCVLFALTPALQATRASLASVLKAGGRAMTVSRERFALRRVLVVAQVALSLVLLAGALLFVRSLRNLLTLDPGFAENGVLIADVDFSRFKVPHERIAAFKQEIVEHLRAIPGVEAAADASVVPLSGDATGNAVWMEGSDASHGKDILRSNISQGYFKTLRTPLLAGRDFDERDGIAAPSVAIVNEEFARQLLAGMNPVGKRFLIEKTPDEPEKAFEIVGLVRNTKYQNIREDSRPIVFLPMLQSPRPSTDDQVLIRSDLPLKSLVSSVRGTLAEINPNISFDFQTLESEIQEGLLRDRLMATLSGFFGILAVLLAMIGLYGVMSYTVARRTGEIGIRMALGANRSEVLRMILKEAGALLLVGLAAGTILVLGAGIAASSMLFGLKPHDPVTLALAVVSLALVAFAASLVPAQRAARLDPMIALRED